MRDQPRVAIVGTGGIFPDAPTPDRLWANVLGAVDASRDVPPGRWLLDPEETVAPGIAVADRVPNCRGYFLDEIRFDAAGTHLSADLLDGLDPLFHLTLAAGVAAWRSARTDDLDRARVGVILGNIALPTEKASELARSVLGRTFAEVIPDSARVAGEVAPLNRYVTGLPAGLLARALGLGGGTFTLDAACASSLYALHLAAEELRSGRADAMLAGGVSRPDSLYTQMGFAQLRALSPRGRCAPFDASADGLVVGEGAGVFVLKRLDDALRDGDRVLAVLVAGGLSNDVGGGILAPDSEGQLRAMRAAYDAAGWSPHDVDLIECHATGTPVGDAVEIRSLRGLWGDSGWRAGQCVLGSVKSTVGHLLTAAGAAAVSKVLSAFAAETLPPTANFSRAAAAAGMNGSPFRVLRAPEPWRARGRGVPRRAAVSGFGFGGINAHLLLEEWQPADFRPRREKTVIPRSSATDERSPGAPVAVVGMDARFGPWKTYSAFRERVLGGGPQVDPERPRRWWGAEDSAWYRSDGLHRDSFAGYFVGEVSAATGRFRIPPRELEEMLPQQLLMLDVAARAAEAAKLCDAERPRTGVFIGIGLDLNTTNYHFRWSVRGDRDLAGPALTANRTMGGLGSIIASRVARELRLGGPSFTVSGEESSGLQAALAAVRALRQGAVDRAIVGAVDLAGDVRAVLATHRHRPYSASGTARPFDAAADGPVIGEGAAAVVLKRLDDAVRDGDRIHAVIRGVGAASGGGPGLPDPGAYRTALERAYEDAGVDPATIGNVEAHGSGDPTEDALEARALAAHFSARGSPPVSIGSVKADVGHAGAAGGLASLVRACQCLEHGVIPAVRGTESRREELGRLRTPRVALPWVRDRADGPRRAGVSSLSVDGNCVHVVLEEHESAGTSVPPVPVSAVSDPEGLFTVSGDDTSSLLDRLNGLRSWLMTTDSRGINTLAGRWLEANKSRPSAALAVALVARNRAELLEQIDAASRSLRERPAQPLPAPDWPPTLRDRVFYSPRPLGREGELALVFPGSGNDFPGMGRDLALWRPDVLRRQDAENERLASQFVADKYWVDEHPSLSVREGIFGQVALGSLVTDLLAECGVRPSAAIGYSLGESAALFGLRAWRDRDGMFRAMHESPLFATDLTGPCDAARRAWGVAASARVEWTSGVVDRGPEVVRRALAGLQKAYLLIVNTPAECVVGGERREVEILIGRLGARFLPIARAATVHCTVAREVADAYRQLHRLPTTPPPRVRFYSTALGRAYDLDSESAADAIVGQALQTIDFPAVVEAAYRDGVRLFVEAGPGASCSRMIDAILGDRAHRARSACVAGANNVSTVLRLLGLLIAERVPVDLRALYPEQCADADEAGHTSTGSTIALRPGGEPFAAPAPPGMPRLSPARQPLPPSVALSPSNAASAAPSATAPVPGLDGLAAVHEARAQAHAAYLRFAESGQRGLAKCLAFQTTLLESLVVGAPAVLLEGAPVEPARPSTPVVLDRGQCLEFAVGSVAKVLGPTFVEVDRFPTRVRLPDEPLMLVDRITGLEGEPRSLGSGRVVTEHDVLPGAWYLDGGHIACSVAIEAGQADLFLSGYLGIDFQTRGLAVYRLLDAAVTFHGSLPCPGTVICYDIRIDRFFRQGDTHLFRFRFEGTVDGQPLLTMTDGCAGFFTAADLAAGKGIVHTALDRRPGRGMQPEEPAELPRCNAESYSLEQVEALRHGDAAGCFGPAFDGIRLADGLRLPSGKLRLVDRVTRLDAKGGRFGVGLVCAEMDIDPEAWFLTCHFVDDRVMPGTLMYECCLHTLRIFLLRRGWVTAQRPVSAEPVPGVTSRLKCRGQVTAKTRTVAYEVTLKELGYRPEAYAIGDAIMYADGKPIVEITNISLRFTGLNREDVRETWTVAAAGATAKRRPLFTEQQMLAFAVGKPSEAFGEPYRAFDKGRFIARLPGPPYNFIHRVTRIDAEPWRMVQGGVVEAEYDVPPDAWYFAADRQPVMPFAALLEVGLQSCGWLAAFMGSALTSPAELSFRNLEGSAELLEEVGPDARMLTTRVQVTRVSRSAGMIIQSYEFAVRRGRRPVYRGETTFGFFSKAALAQQVGLTDAVVHQPGTAEAARAEAFDYPDACPLPDERWRMIDRVDALVPDGGPHGLGFIRGTKQVRPEEWFFKAHFFQDPVMPGSLGLEALIQLLKVYAVRRWGGERFRVMGGRPHSWKYRGQVLPADRRVTVTAVVTARDDACRTLAADGILAVDGRTIYKMKDFTLVTASDGS